MMDSESVNLLLCLNEPQTGDYESDLETPLCHYLDPPGGGVYSAKSK